MSPLITITIPTLNSAGTLTPLFESIRSQTYPHIETVVVDSHSTDGTVQLSQSYGARVIETDYGRLGARYVGVKAAQGELVVLLDSDQRFARKDVMERVVDAMQSHDMLVLEEKSLEARTWVQKLASADRELLHALFEQHLDPMRGVLAPRAYEKKLLLSAMERIPEPLYRYAAGFEDAIIYSEAYTLSQRVGLLKDALYHTEPRGLLELWKKSYRYGRTTGWMVSSGYYSHLVRRKIKLRRGDAPHWRLALESHLLLMLKAPAFALGYLLGWFHNNEYNEEKVK